MFSFEYPMWDKEATRVILYCIMKWRLYFVLFDCLCFYPTSIEVGAYTLYKSRKMERFALNYFSLPFSLFLSISSVTHQLKEKNNPTIIALVYFSRGRIKPQTFWFSTTLNDKQWGFASLVFIFVYPKPSQVSMKVQQKWGTNWVTFLSSFSCFFILHSSSKKINWLYFNWDRL